MRLPPSLSRRTAGLPRLASLIALLIAMSLVVAACGGVAQSAMDDGEAPVVEESPSIVEDVTASPPARELNEEPTWIPYTGELDTWPSTSSEWADFLYAFWSSDPTDFGLPDGCVARGDAPELGPEDCIEVLYAQRGASEAAITMVRETGLMVFDVVGTAPVQVVDALEIGSVHTNYQGRMPNLVFTPRGALELSGQAGTWRPMVEAFAEALATPFGREVERIGREETERRGGCCFGIGVGGYSSFGVPLVAPLRTDGGWSVRFWARSGTGATCCSWTVAASFLLEFDEEGNPIGIRFVEWCDTAPDGSTGFGSYGDPEDGHEMDPIRPGLPACG